MSGRLSIAAINASANFLQGGRQTHSAQFGAVCEGMRVEGANYRVGDVNVCNSHELYALYTRHLPR